MITRGKHLRPCRPGLALAVLGCALLGACERTPPQAETPRPAAPSAAAVAEQAPVFPEAALTLGGVTLLGQNAIALISVDGRPQEPYRVGQEIVAGIRVGTIYADHVVLKYRDRYRILRLKGRAAAPPERAAEIYTYHNPLLDPDAANDNASAEDFLREVRVSAHYGGGFLVEDVAFGSIFDRLGVRPGDVVYSLDTLTIVKLEELSKQSGVTDPAETRLEVVRNGERVSLRYQFPADG